MTYSGVRLIRRTNQPLPYPTAGSDFTHDAVGKSGWKDWSLTPVILDGDWTFVTQNAVDFRGPPASPGSKGQYADVTIHAGLICLNGPSTGMDLDMMMELFEVALRALEQDGDLVNQVLEVTLEGDEIRILRYILPRG